MQAVGFDAQRIRIAFDVFIAQQLVAPLLHAFDVTVDQHIRLLLQSTLKIAQDRS